MNTPTKNNESPGSFFSIIVPVFGCRNCLIELFFRIKKTMEILNTDFEVIFINDQSPDESWTTIIEMSEKDLHVKGINLSRNFGQHYAITAGLDHCTGDWIVVMDCDLQDQPEEIIKLYQKALEGFDVVFGQRIIRKDPIFKKLASKLFYKLFDYFTENNSDPSIANFGIFSKKVISYYQKMREKSRAFPLFVKWLGFKTGYVEVEHATRRNGKSTYNYSKLINLAIDLIIAQSNKPLKLSVKFGFLLSFLSFIYGLHLIFRYFFFNVPLGWTSLMVTIFFIGGLLFANLGLLGLYIGKIFDETKNRPLYVIKDIIGDLKTKI